MVEIKNKDIEEKVNLLLEKLNSEDVEIKQEAAYDIWKLTEIYPGDLQILIPILKQSTKDENWVVRKMAIQAFIELEAMAEIPTIISMLLEDKDGEVRTSAIEALTKLEVEEAIPQIITALKDSERVVYELAAWSLGSFGKKASGAVPMLIELLSKTTPGIINMSSLAAWSLGEIGDKTAIPHLKIAYEKVEYLEDQFKIAYAIAQLEDGIGFGTEELQKLQASGKLLDDDCKLIDELIQSKMK